MEELNEDETKNEHKHKDEHACCSNHGKGDRACCSGFRGMHIFIKIVVILAVFFIGVCIGYHGNRYSDKGNFGGNYHHQGGCAMMRGNGNYSAHNPAGMGMTGGCQMMGAMNSDSYFQNNVPAQMTGCPMMTGANNGGVMSATVISKPAVAATTTK